MNSARAIVNRHAVSLYSHCANARRESSRAVRRVANKHIAEYADAEFIKKAKAEDKEIAEADSFIDGEPID